MSILLHEEDLDEPLLGEDFLNELCLFVCKEAEIVILMDAEEKARIEKMLRAGGLV